jgi:hypothetical protein
MRPTYATRLRLDPARLPADTPDALAYVAGLVDRWFRAHITAHARDNGYRLALPSPTSGPRGFASATRGVHGQIDPLPGSGVTSWRLTYTDHAVLTWGDSHSDAVAITTDVVATALGGGAVEVSLTLVGEFAHADALHPEPGYFRPPTIVSDLLGTGAVVDGGVPVPFGPLAADDPRLPSLLTHPERTLPIVFVRRGGAEPAAAPALTGSTHAHGIAFVVDWPDTAPERDLAGATIDPGGGAARVVWPGATLVGSRPVDRRWRAPVLADAGLPLWNVRIAAALFAAPLEPWQQRHFRQHLPRGSAAARWRWAAAFHYPTPLDYANDLADWREQVDRALFAAVTANAGKPFAPERLDIARKAYAAEFAREFAPPRPHASATAVAAPDDAPAVDATAAPDLVAADATPAASPPPSPPLVEPPPAPEPDPEPAPAAVVPATDPIAATREPEPEPPVAEPASVLGRIGRDLQLFARGLDTLLAFEHDLVALADRLASTEADLAALRADNARLAREVEDLRIVHANGGGALARRFQSLPEVVAFVAADHDPAVVTFHRQAHASAAASTFAGSLYQAWEALERIANIAGAHHNGWLTGSPRSAFEATGALVVPDLSKAAAAHPDPYHVPWPDPDGPRKALTTLVGALRDDAGRPTLWIALFLETTPHRRVVVGHVGDALPGRG